MGFPNTRGAMLESLEEGLPCFAVYIGVPPPFGETDIDVQEAGEGTRRIEEVDPVLQQAQCHVRRLHMP